MLSIDSGDSGAELQSHIPKPQARGGLGEVTPTMTGVVTGPTECRAVGERVNGRGEAALF